MWQYTASHYRNTHVVVGYDLMVEPNSNDVFFKTDDVTAFYPQYAGTLYDWNPLQLAITSAIRGVDSLTPILVGGMNYSGINWLSSLQLSGDPRTVYAVHQYQPDAYTHADRPRLNYPGSMTTDTGKANVNLAWLSQLLNPVTDFRGAHASVPIVVNEFGAMRWELGVDKFIGDEMSVFEKNGYNHAIWLWETSLPIDWDEFNFRHGPNKSNKVDVSDSALMEVLRQNWGQNLARPTAIPVWPTQP